MASELRRVYHDLNAHLVERQILPEMQAVVQAQSFRARAGARAAAGRLRRPRRSPTSTPRWRGCSAPPARRDGRPGARGRRDRQVAPATRGFVQSLTGLQQPGADAIATAAGLANVIRDLKAAPQSAALPGVDALTIDIVAMLFDFVFEDRQIPGDGEGAARAPADPDAQGGAARPRASSPRAPTPRGSCSTAWRAPPSAWTRRARAARPRSRKLEEVVGRVLARIRRRHRALRHARRRDGGVPRPAGRGRERDRDAHRPARGGARAARDRPRRRGGGGGPPARRARLGSGAGARHARGRLGARARERPRRSRARARGPWIAMLTTVDELLWSVEPKATRGGPPPPRGRDSRAHPQPARGPCAGRRRGGGARGVPRGAGRLPCGRGEGRAQGHGVAGPARGAGRPRRRARWPRPRSSARWFPRATSTSRRSA